MGGRKARAVIDLAALRHNYLRARKLSHGREVISVVKADAYGHGVGPVAKGLVAAGCRRLAVVSIEEACELRELGVASELLVLGGLTNGREARLAADHGLCPVLHHFRDLELARESARYAERPLAVEMEVDTGMQRMGVARQEAVSMALALDQDPHIRLAGLFTHFSNADDLEPDVTLGQVRAFRAVLEELRQKGVDPGRVHAANSSALHAGSPLLDALPEASAVRPGLLLYGAKVASHEDPDRDLEPVMSVRTRVVAVREIRAGEGVGYGGTWVAKSSTRVATLPIGYGDGVLRNLSNCGSIWLAGAPRSIVGRISMDYLTVEVGEARVEVGDPATYFGRPEEGGQGIPVEVQAEAAGTLAYELLVRVGDRVVREAVDGS